MSADPRLADDLDGPTGLSRKNMSEEEFQQIVTGEVSPFSLDTVFWVQERARPSCGGRA